MRSINFKTSYEDIITRIMGLFAYIETNENGISVLHKATDNPMGCYGKIVENLKYDVAVDLKINEEILLKGGNTYSFKTLMNLYYVYKDYEIADGKIVDESENIITGYEKLKEFIERGVGKVEVNITKTDEMDLVPDHIYLIQSEKLYNDLYNLKVVCDLYEIHMENKTELDKETELDMCCKCQQYQRKGGDRMLNFLKEKIQECKNIATEYKKYAEQRENSLTINYNINLYSSDRDLGVVTPIETLNNKTHSQLITNTNTGENYFEETFNTNSKLKSLRKRQKYINALDEEETPQTMEDWLYFYRVGYINNITVLNDNLGNILAEYTNMADVAKGDVVTDLYAYGDVIESITLSRKTEDYYKGNLSGEDYENAFDNMLNAFKVVYWTDVHLTAKCNEVGYDDDGNKLVYFSNFKPDYWYQTGCGSNPNDEIDYHGVRYEEIYHFGEDSEIVNLIKEDKFSDYVKGKFDVDYVSDDDVEEYISDDLKLFEKYMFSLYINTRTRSKQLSQTKTSFNDIDSSATIRITQYIDETETEDLNTIKTDDDTEIIVYPNSISRHEFYDGIAYTPTEELNVYIDRGTTSIFDKHIRFGEIKTLQDMEEFTNGSFFKLQE